MCLFSCRKQRLLINNKPSWFHLKTAKCALITQQILTSVHLKQDSDQDIGYKMPANILTIVAVGDKR